MESASLTVLLEALAESAARIAESPVTLVSVTFDWIGGDTAAARPEVEITRATRTIVFSNGRLLVGDRLVATATAVHRIDPA
jgi:hypothetical protein